MGSTTLCSVQYLNILCLISIRKLYSLGISGINTKKIKNRSVSYFRAERMVFFYLKPHCVRVCYVVIIHKVVTVFFNFY